MKLYDDMPLHTFGFPVSAPSINFSHVDGPLLTFSDGQLHWLTWLERYRVWRGYETAATLQRKLRPRLSAGLEYYWANRGSS